MNARSPNIVLMIAHDLGCHIGPYGHATECSPTLNQLAAQSTRFTSHFVTSPGCSQSRSSLITGRYPHSNGQFGLAHLGWRLHSNEPLLPELLRAGGYHTVLIGIWHLHPWTLRGFTQVSDDVATADSSPEGFAEVASGRAADWITHHAPSSEPFYLHVGFWETHRPFCGTEAARSAAAAREMTAAAVPDYLPDNEPTRREVAELHESIQEVDRGVGRILEALDSAGFSDNTLVLFTADHGLPFPRAKGTLYDPGIQVCLLARWPGRVPANAKNTALTSNLDLAPTLLSLAGQPTPATMQGQPIGCLLEQQSSDSNREAIFAEKTYHEHYDPMRCIRTATHKLIRNGASRPRLVLPSDIYNSPTRQSMRDDESIWSARPPWELYDLASDPAEVQNLAGNAEHREIEESLGQRLNSWMESTQDPLLRGPIERPAPSV